MPLLKIRPYLINTGSFTGSFSGTSSYARRALTASYVLGGAAGSSGTSGATGATGTSGTSGNSGTSGSSGSSGSAGSSGTGGTSGATGTSGTSGGTGASGSSGTSGTGSPGTSGTAGSSGVSATSTLQTGSIAKQTLWTNVTSGSTNTITGLNLSGNKWDVNVIEEWDAKTIPGDQYYNSCSLLMHFNGTNGSTTFTDNSLSNLTVTSNNGAAISTAQSKFGGASVFFDGTDDYLSSVNNSAFNLSSGDFTVEFWFRTSTLSLPSSHAVLVGQMSYTSAGWGIWQYSSTTIYVYIGTGFAIQTPSVFTSTSTWYHIALVKNGTGANSLKLYVDGVVQAQGNYTPTYASSYPLVIGGITTSTGWNNNFYSNGYIDELRITKGVARYTSNFTPPNSQFYNNPSTYQSLTKYIGTVGGLNDRSVDYGVQKLSDTSLKVVKMTTPTNPSSGSLSASIDRVYINVLDYTKVSVTSSYARNALTASYILGGGANGSSGTSGATGASGTSGTSGSSGATGASGTSGTSGATGTSGSAGSSGTSGTSGATGTSGTSGGTGTSGSSGTSGTGSPGTSGTAGSSGVSATSTLQTGSLAKQTILYNVTSGSQNIITGLNLSGNKWGIDIKEEWDAKSGDLYYNNVSLLLHFSGSNGSTTFRDNSRNNFTVTSNNGAAISTAQSKFGGASGLFDGTNDYCTVSDNSVFDFGSGDFTIEYWEYRTVSTIYKPVLSRNNSSYPPFMVGWSESGNVTFFSSTDGASWNVASAVSMGTITTNVWTHYAVTRQGNTFRTFQNGTQISTFTSAATLPAGAGTLLIGAYATPAYFYQGYLDELRITKGVARYTGNFTVPSAEFPNLSQQSATKYVGLIGGLNDRSVDYGIQKLSDSSLKVVKMSQTTSPFPSGSLSASVDRVYVNVLDYTKVSLTSSYSLLSKTASYALNGGTSLVNQTMRYISGSNIYTLSRSIVSPSDVLLSVNGIIQTPTTDYTVSASTVTFTESYPSGSKINARYLVAATNSSNVNLANIVLTGTTTGDAYYPQVSVLLHFDGVNGSTVITDNSKNVLTVTSNNGAAISTAQSKFGGASCFFDGTNDYLSLSSDAKFAISTTEDYTVECWVNFRTVQDCAFWQTTNNPSSADGPLWFGYASGKLYSSRHGSGLYAVSYVWSPSTNTWYHVAVTRASGTVRLFVDGVVVTTDASTQNGISFTQSGGAVGLLTTPAYFNGYIDELRVTKGYARYTSNFTPSTTAFADGGGDVGKALVVNSTATGVSIGTAGYLSSQLAKAWVNFNGTGTVAIRDSYNVSSITDNGVGDYTINYNTALNNSNYAISGITDYNESGLHRVIVYRSGLSHQYNTLGVRIQIIGQSGSSDNTQDPTFASLMVLGN